MNYFSFNYSNWIMFYNVWPYSCTKENNQDYCYHQCNCIK